MPPSRALNTTEVAKLPGEVNWQTTVHDADGNAASTTDPLGHVTRYGYLCPCQLGGVDFFWFGGRLPSRGIDRFSLAHSSMAA